MRQNVGQLLSVVASVWLASCGAPPPPDTNTTVAPTGSVVAPGTSGVAPAQSTDPLATTTAATGATSAPPTGCIKTPSSELLVTLSEATNYSFTNDIVVETTSVKPNAFITIDWSGLTQDFLKQPLDPQAGVDMISIVLWKLQHEEIIQDLNEDTLGNRGVSGAIFKPTNRAMTSTTTQGMIIKGNTEAQKDEDILNQGFDATAVPPSEHTYTFMVNKGLDVGQGVKMIHAVKLDPTSENTTVTFSNTSTQIMYTADLHTNPALTVPANTNAIFLDWKSMAKNALGRDFLKRQVAEVRVVHVPKTPAEIEAEFLGLETLGDVTYRGAVCEDGVMALSALTDENGAPFTGIDPTLGGTWLLALMCSESKCGNPAPWYMARLEAAP